MAPIEIGGVINGCAVTAGPVQLRRGDRWAFRCVTCSHVFECEDRYYVECEPCALRLASDVRAALDAVRGVRRAVAIAARAAAQQAARQGVIARPGCCSHCGKRRLTGRRLNAHHESYARPLDVTWLCTACHATRHLVLRHEGIDLYVGTPGEIIGFDGGT